MPEDCLEGEGGGERAYLLTRHQHRQQLRMASNGGRICLRKKGIQSQEKDSSEGLLLPYWRPQVVLRIWSRKRSNFRTSPITPPVIEATALLEEDGRSSWSEFWDLFDSNQICNRSAHE